jgi:HK97 family phage portal protein
MSRPSRALRESRAAYTRTWQNVADNGGGGLLRNAPGGFPSSGPRPQRVWRGSDSLQSYGFGGFDDGGYWNGSEGGWVTTNRTWSGQPASLPAVGRATNLIVDTIAGLPWWLGRDRERLALPAWLADPQNRRGDPRLGGTAVSDGASAVSWRTSFLISMLWYGDGFIYTPNRGADGTPLPPVFVLDPWDIETVGPGSTDSRPPGHYVAGGSERIDDNVLVHVRGEGPYDENGRGFGVLTRYARSYGLLGQIGEYSDGMYGSGVPAGYLKVQSPNISDTQAEDLRSKWMDRHGRGRGIAVLNSVTEFTPLAFSPVDAALIDSKRLSMLDIALAFGVPPHMLGLPTADDTYANVESRMLEFVQFTVLPWVRRVESGLDSEFALGTGLKIDLRGLLRADTAVRVSAYHYGLTDGWMTKDEVRDLEDLPPLTAAQHNELQPPAPAAAPVAVPVQLAPVPTQQAVTA